MGNGAGREFLRIMESEFVGKRNVSEFAGKARIWDKFVDSVASSKCLASMFHNNKKSFALYL